MKLYLEADDGALYSLTRVGSLATGFTGWRLVQLQGKRVGAAYVVGEGGGCDCPDAQYRQREGGCKHQRALVGAGLVAGAAVLVRSAGE